MRWRREREGLERERESDGGVRGFPRATENAEGKVLARHGKSFKKGGFGVESKSFEVEVEEKKGRLQATIVEWKKGISLWIRLGSASLGLFLDCLVLCIKDVRMVKWVRKWKENGRAYSLVRDQNKGGCFLRLDVVDLENKRFSIFIPKERGAKGGWVSMVETLRRLGCAYGGMISQKEEELRLKPSMVKTFTKVVKMPRGKDRATIRVEVTKKESYAGT